MCTMHRTRRAIHGLGGTMPISMNKEGKCKSHERATNARFNDRKSQQGVRGMLHEIDHPDTTPLRQDCTTFTVGALQPTKKRYAATSWIPTTFYHDDPKEMAKAPKLGGEYGSSKSKAKTYSKPTRRNLTNRNTSGKTGCG